MKCPECDQEYHCPCDACEVNFPQHQPKFIRVNYIDGDNWDEQCPKCGFTRSIHWWFDYEGEYYVKLKESKTQCI